jgi:hypothetical protein
MSLAACIAVAVALLATLDRSEETFPTARTAVVVLDVPPHLDLGRLLRDRAVHDHVDFFRVQADPVHAGRRIVDPVVGDRATFDRVFRDGRYRGGPAEQTVVLRRTHTSDRGVYFSTMSSPQASAFVAELRSVGVDARAEAAGWWTAMAFTLGRPGTGLALGASLVAVALLGRLRGVTAARRLAVTEILGVPCSRSREAAGVLRGQATVALGAAIAGSAVALAAVGGQVPAVLVIAGGVYSVHAGLFLVAMASGWHRDGTTRMRAGWSAWRPWGRSAVSASVIRVAAIVSVALAAGPLADSGALLAQYQRVSETLVDCADCTTPLLSGTLQPDEIEAAAPAFARLFRAVDDGRSVLASHPIVPIDESIEPDVGNTLVVNREYLERVGQPFSDPWPGRTTVGPGEWAVFVPTDDVPATTIIADTWRAWFGFQREIDRTLAEPREPVVLEYSPRSVFDFGAATDEAPLFAEAPVIAVVPASSELLSGDFLTAAASNGQFLLDVDDPERLIASVGLADIVGSFHRWPDEMEAHLNSIIRSTVAEAIAAVVALTVIGTAVFVQVEALRWKDTARVRDAVRLGLGSFRVHGRLLMVEGVLAVVSVVVAGGAARGAGAAAAPALIVAVIVSSAATTVVWSVARKLARSGDDDAS